MANFKLKRKEKMKNDINSTLSHYRLLVSDKKNITSEKVSWKQIAKRLAHDLIKLKTNPAEEFITKDPVTEYKPNLPIEWKNQGQTITEKPLKSPFDSILSDIKNGKFDNNTENNF